MGSLRRAGMGNGWIGERPHARAGPGEGRERRAREFGRRPPPHGSGLSHALNVIDGDVPATVRASRTYRRLIRPLTATAPVSITVATAPQAANVALSADSWRTNEYVSFPSAVSRAVTWTTAATGWPTPPGAYPAPRSSPAVLYDAVRVSVSWISNCLSC